MDLPPSAPQDRRGGRLRKSLLDWLGLSLIALVLGFAVMDLGGFTFWNPGFLGRLLVFALAIIGLGVGLTRKQETMVLVAVVAMVLSGSCTVVTYIFGGRARDLTPVMYKRLGGDEAEPKGPAQHRDNRVPHEK